MQKSPATSSMPVVIFAENQPEIAHCSMQFPSMAGEGTAVTGKKFKITIKHLWNDAADNAHEKTVVKDTVDNGKRGRVIGAGSKRVGVNVIAKSSMEGNTGKRKREISLDGQRENKQRVDRNLKLQLSKILKELIHHRFGWVFREPVDPVKLQIPDYFDIISKPMDLGTILHKLEENVYSSAHEVVADVRLTFANAMSYNPPGSDVHNYAKKLDAVFSGKWKLLEEKLKFGKKNDECFNGRDTKQTGGNNHQNVNPIGLNRAPLPVKLGTSRLMSLEEKQKFRLELVQLRSKRMMENLQKVFQKFGLSGLNQERLDSYIDSTDDETLWKLRREVKALLSAKDGKVKAGKIALKGCSSLTRTSEKEHCSQSALASVVSTNERQSIDSACLRIAQGCTSDISSERSIEHNQSGDSKLEGEVKYFLESRTSGCSLESDGPGVIVIEANSPHLSTPAFIEGWTFNVQMSPNKALRAAMLKKRFADTIFRATHHELLDHGDKTNPLKVQQEKERLEREQREEKARIEAQIKAAEAASRRRKQEDLKMRYERERKNARIALEKIERSVELNDNAGVFKDLEIMGCRYLYYPTNGNGMGHDGIHYGNALQQLGLYLKDDDFSDEERDAILNSEEGEILS